MRTKIGKNAVFHVEDAALLREMPLPFRSTPGLLHVLSTCTACILRTNSTLLKPRKGEDMTDGTIIDATSAAFSETPVKEPSTFFNDILSRGAELKF